MSKRHLYYHIYLTDDHAKWVYPFLEQFKLMEDVGLLDMFDSIDVSVISSGMQKLDNFVRLIDTYDTKKNIVVHAYDTEHVDDHLLFGNLNARSNALTENITMKRIFDDVHSRYDDNDLVLYLHAKGLTSVDNHLMRGQANTFKNYYYWRHFLNYGVIEKWKECVDAVSNDFDIAGANYFDDPVPHFSGTMWWANVKYLRSLPNPESLDWWNEMKSETSNQWLKTAENRFRDEMWICSNKNHKAFVSAKNDDKRYLSAELLRRNEYDN